MKKWNKIIFNLNIWSIAIDSETEMKIKSSWKDLHTFVDFFYNKDLNMKKQNKIKLEYLIYCDRLLMKKWK